MVGSILVTEKYSPKKSTHQNVIWILLDSEVWKKEIQASWLICTLQRQTQVWAGHDKYIIGR